MGVIIKELEEMKVASFTGFAPEPETKAHDAMNAWMKANRMEDTPHRIFGHNIDRAGNLSCDPHNVGYKFMVTIDRIDTTGFSEATYGTIKPGRFVVTGIEGCITGGDGSWIGEGWQKMNEMIREKGYKVKRQPMWFEEELKPSVPGNLRLDLYLEIE